MNVKEYIKNNGLDKLVNEFKIIVTDYPDRIVLNYNQIESPRFNSIVDECRGLILRKETWEVLARSFNRFYNLCEGVQSDKNTTLDVQRVATMDGSYQETKMDINGAVIQEKLDGSLISMYFDGEKWCFATRKMAFGEGKSVFGRTFADVFKSSDEFPSVMNFVSSDDQFKKYTLVFELTGPENRVVTPYEGTHITLIGARFNEYGWEASSSFLDGWAAKMKCPRPKTYKVYSWENVMSLVSEFPSMQEGVVILFENEKGFMRVKCKNPKYVAIAHMRENGGISPKNVLKLVMENEQHEYLKYFECDKKYFDFVEKEYKDVFDRVNRIAAETMSIEDQKTFALTIMKMTKTPIENGILFGIRKGKSINDFLREMGAKKLSKAMNLSGKFVKEFGVVFDDGDET